MKYKMKITHRPEEAKSYFENGVIVRLDGKGNVIGLDITDSSRFFSGDDEIDLKEA